MDTCVAQALELGRSYPVSNSDSVPCARWPEDEDHTTTKCFAMLQALARETAGKLGISSWCTATVTLQKPTYVCGAGDGDRCCPKDFQWALLSAKVDFDPEEFVL
jgi:hypothetical protein